MQLLDISEQIHNIEFDYKNGTLGWKEICFKIPIIASLTAKDSRRRRETDPFFDNSSDFSFEEVSIDENEIIPSAEREMTSTTELIPTKRPHRGRTLYKPDVRPFNPSVSLPSFIFCSIVNSLPVGCMIQNILELWNFDANKIKNLTKEDILTAIHRTNISSTTGHETAFDRLLGGVTRNETGHIVSATGLLTHWMVHIDFLRVNHDTTGNAAGTEDWASEEALAFEKEFLDTMDILSDNLRDDETEIFYSAGRR